MSSWIKLLPLELSQIEEDEIIEPETEVKRSAERVVGEMSIDLKRIYTRWRILFESADRAILEAKYSRKKEQQKELIARALELHEKAEAMEKIFWISIKDEFGLWGLIDNDENSVGVRKGFKVVSFKQDPSEALRDFLRGLP